MKRNANDTEMTLRADCGELGLRRQDAICQCCDGHSLDQPTMGNTDASETAYGYVRNVL